MFEASVRFMWPGLHDPKLMGFGNIGIGTHYLLIPYILSPGIFIEGGIGTDWFEMFSDKHDVNKEYNQLGFNIEGRLYNLIEIKLVHINMFIGYSLLLGQLDKRSFPAIHNPILGDR